MVKNYLKICVIYIVSLTSTSVFAQNCNTSVTNITGSSSICNGSFSTLSATHDGDNVYWFDSQSNGTLLYTGNPFQTLPLNNTTSFWAESRKQELGTPTSGGAKLTKTSTSGTTVVTTTSPWGLVFNATQSFVLNSVDVFLSSANPGVLVLNLKDSNQNLLQVWTINTPAGGTGSNPLQFTVPLNYTIPIGNGYRLVAVSSPSMIRDLSSNSFPYAIGSVGSVTQGTINNSLTSNPGVYYFFYNWNYTPVSNCVSTRQEFIVTVNNTDLPTGNSQQLFVLGQTIADLSVSGTSLIWYSDAAGTSQIPTSTLLVDGATYYVSQTLNGCESELLAVTAVTTLNIESNIFSKLVYFPNPVKDFFLISNETSINSIEIYTILGQLVFQENYNLKEVKLNLSSLANGSYWVKISNQDESKTIKIYKN